MLVLLEPSHATSEDVLVLFESLHASDNLLSRVSKENTEEGKQNT